MRNMSTTQVTTQRNIGTAITSAVLGLIAFTTAMVLSVPLGTLLAVVGLMFGGLAVYRSRDNKSVWIPALAISGVTILLSVLTQL
jgi:uncharacterized membrane protein